MIQSAVRYCWKDNGKWYLDEYVNTMNTVNTVDTVNTDEYG